MWPIGLRPEPSKQVDGIPVEDAVGHVKWAGNGRIMSKQAHAKMAIDSLRAVDSC